MLGLFQLTPPPIIEEVLASIVVASIVVAFTVDTVLYGLEWR